MKIRHTIQLATGVVHEIPADLELMLTHHPKLAEKWNSLTPLSRNEWICWVTFVKQQTTRENHLRRLHEEILLGKKRPCCWPGCPHRNENAKKWFRLK